jgi:hypothetical protein
VRKRLEGKGLTGHPHRCPQSSWLVHMGTSPESRQDMAADIFQEDEYQLGSQW